MTWIRLSPGWMTHPKHRDAGPQGKLLWLAGLDYSVSQLTDGVIPKNVLPVLAVTAEVKPTVARKLVEVGLWHDKGDHYEIHDWADYQPSKADVEQARSAGRARAAKHYRRTTGRDDEPPPEHHPPPSSNGNSSREETAQTAQRTNESETAQAAQRVQFSSFNENPLVKNLTSRAREAVWVGDSQSLLLAVCQQQARDELAGRSDILHPDGWVTWRTRELYGTHSGLLRTHPQATETELSGIVSGTKKAPVDPIESARIRGENMRGCDPKDIAATAETYTTQAERDAFLGTQRKTAT